jgi:AcrR family transcriptional regulator
MADERAPDGTRERILSAALPLFAEHGYDGASVRTIAGAAGVNVATLAYHFTDKDGLYAACVERLYAELATLPAPSGDGDPLDELVRSAWSFAREHRVGIRLLHRHLLDRGRHHDVAAGRWLEPLIARVDPLLAALRPDWAPAERRLLLFSAQHLIVRFVLDDPRDLAATLGVPVGDVDPVVTGFIGRLVRSVTVR